MYKSEAVIHPGGGETVINLGTLVRIKVGSTDTNGAFSIVEHIVPPQAGPPLHTHPETEVLYVLAGEFEVGIGSELTRVSEGAVIHVRPNTPHSTKNIGPQAGRLLSVYMPGAADRFFLEAGTPLAPDAAQPDFDQPVDMSDVDIPRVLAIAARHGMRIV
jgi:quercetin dioxygenase-like cupin family protein